MSTMVQIEVPKEVAEMAARLAWERAATVGDVLREALGRELGNTEDLVLPARAKLPPEELSKLLDSLAGAVEDTEFKGMTAKEIRHKRLEEELMTKEVAQERILALGRAAQDGQGELGGLREEPSPGHPPP